nr:immunoglobulin light chain junction region [Macaca mulatta]MOW39404.1 immunoglobulin light chain junction region [Macaca mulatta]
CLQRFNWPTWTC